MGEHVLAVSMVTVVINPAPVQPPLQAPKTESEALAAAVNVTILFISKSPVSELQAPSQSIPIGALVTVPLPAPALFYVRVLFCRLNVAVHVLAFSLVTVVLNPSPLQPPLQALLSELLS